MLHTENMLSKLRRESLRFLQLLSSVYIKMLQHNPKALKGYALKLVEAHQNLKKERCCTACNKHLKKCSAGYERHL